MVMPTGLRFSVRATGGGAMKCSCSSLRLRSGGGLSGWNGCVTWVCSAYRPAKSSYGPSQTPFTSRRNTSRGLLGWSLPSRPDRESMDCTLSISGSMWLPRKHSAGMVECSRVAPMHCCTGAPSDPYVPLVAAYGSSKPQGRSGGEVCWFFLGAGCPALAVRVDQAGAVRCARVPLGGHVLLGDRLAGDPVPLFPLGGAGWVVVGVQEQVPGQGGASVLLGEQDQDAAVEQGSVLAASLGPVVGQGGVVRGRRAEDQTVSDDLCPAEFR